MQCRARWWGGAVAWPPGLGKVAPWPAGLVVGGAAARGSWLGGAVGTVVEHGERGRSGVGEDRIRCGGIFSLPAQFIQFISYTL